jgi:membrane fusion protein, multidrug efflux system
MESTESPKPDASVVEQNGQAPTVQDPPISSPTPPSPKKVPVKRFALFGGFGVLAIAAAMFGYRWGQFVAHHQETDDAYVTADVHPVNARISGTVMQVNVADNQTVSPGAVLVKLDPRDYEVALQQADAALEAAKQQAAVAQANIGVTSTNAQGQTTQAQGTVDAAIASIGNAKSAVVEAQVGVPATEAQLAQVEANLTKAKLDHDRYRRLLQNGAVPRSQYDAAKATYGATLTQREAVKKQIDQSKAKVAEAEQNMVNAQAKLSSTQGTLTQADATQKQTDVNRRQYRAALAAIAQSQAQVKNAQLQLSYTTIQAPVAGSVGNKTVQVGQRVQPGQTLMSVVAQPPWIVANFKETQLAKMQPGQDVEIKIDAIPNQTFKGKLDSLSPASGARFALLPPDNATGNFTKIVQRIPVKIVFDPNSAKDYTTRIAPGMSAVVTVETR